MFLCHVLDDFVLQPVCLGKLKQRDWWIKQEGMKDLYKNDYKMALHIHAFSWSGWILVPFIFFSNVEDTYIFTMFLINGLIHYMVDNKKANDKDISLVTDQLIHIGQVVITFLILIYV